MSSFITNLLYMKKFFSLLLLLTTLTVGANAQLVSLIAGAIKKAVPIYTPGVITYKDGHKVEYMWVELPKSGDVSIKVSNDPKHKNADEVDASEIKYITYWSQQFPEKKLTLYKLHADKSNIPFTATMQVEVWGYPIAASEWGIVYKCHPRYELNKKTGEIELCYDVRSVQMGNTVHYETVAASCFLQCKDFENAQLIGGSLYEESMHWVTIKMKHVAPFFASNPTMQKSIEEKKLTGADIQYILDEMAIFHELKDSSLEPTTPTETSISEATINGTIGDDE